MSSFASGLAAIYNDEYKHLTRMLVRQGVSAQAAADAVQEAFARVLRSPSGEIRDLKSYLRRAAKNAAIDLRRSENRAASVFDPVALVEDALADPHPLADAVMISREEEVALDAAIRELPARCRQVLILHKFEGLSYAEIADRLGIAKNTVMVHMVKAVGHMKSRLREK